MDTTTLTYLGTRRVRLQSDDPDTFCRADITLTDDANDALGGVVSINIAPLMGEQRRYIDLTPAEARVFAKYLCEIADVVEAKRMAAE